MANKNSRLKNAVDRVLPQKADPEPWESVRDRAREALEGPIKGLAALKRPPVELDAEGRPLPVPRRDRLTGATGRPVDASLIAPDGGPEAAPIGFVLGRQKFKGRRMPPAALAEAYRHRGPLALDVLTKICTQYLADDPRVSAAEAEKAARTLTDRAYGRAPEVVQVQAAERDSRLVLKPSEMSVEDLVLYASLLRRNKAKLLSGRKFDSSGRLVAADDANTTDAGPVTGDPEQGAD